MKASIWIEGGVQQVVLTPENEWERTALRAIQEKQHSVQAFWGAFYNCAGGWLRQASHQVDMYPAMHKINEDASLIFRLEDRAVIIRSATERRRAAADAIIKDLIERSVIGKAFEAEVLAQHICGILEGHVQ